ncbi:MAG: sulfotransferase [Pseudomonadota bacterium]
MPNTDNITRPFTLVSFGRSGTSLVHNILAAHPDVEGCGETQPLIFGTWEGTRRVGGVVRMDQSLPAGTAHETRCAKSVRAVFLSMFPDDGTKHWVHKPINVPFTINQQQRRFPKRFDAHAKDYWKVIGGAFPDGKVITVLRHPYDVALSATRYWENPIDRIWRSIVNMAQILSQDSAPVSLALRHHVLATDPTPEISRLLDHLGLDHHPACFEAAEKVYVSKPGSGRRPKSEMTDHTRRAFSHRAEWDQLDMSSFTDQDRQILINMWAKYGEPLNF